MKFEARVQKHFILKTGDEFILDYRSAQDEYSATLNGEIKKIDIGLMSIGIQHTEETFWKIKNDWYKYFYFGAWDYEYGKFLLNKTFTVEKMLYYEYVDHKNTSVIAEYPDLRLKSVYIPEYGITTSDSNALHRVELELELKLRQLEKKQIERIEKNKEYQEKERAREERIRKHPWTKWF